MAKTSPQPTYTLHDVFDAGSKVPQSYFNRGNLDDRIRTAQDSGKPIVIVGPSRQGKTILRKRHFQDNEVVICQVDSRWTADMIYAQILVGLNPRLQVEVVNETSGGAHIRPAGLFDMGADGTHRVRYAMRTGTLKDEVIDALLRANENSTRWCVIDDCHLLPVSELESLAAGVKSMYDRGVRIVIVAAWYGRNRLADTRPDLGLERCELIPVHWTDDELRQVLVAGQHALNIRFSDEVERDMVLSAAGLVGRLQWMAAKYCEKQQITKTMPPDKKGQTRSCDDTSPLKQARDEMCEQIGDPYRRYARAAIGAFNPRNEAPAEHDTFFGYIAQACWNWEALPIERLLKGISLTDFAGHVQALRPSTTITDVETRLLKINQRQVASGQPELIQYGTDGLVRIIDYDFFFFRMWGGLDWIELRKELRRR